VFHTKYFCKKIGRNLLQIIFIKIFISISYKKKIQNKIDRKYIFFSSGYKLQEKRKVYHQTEKIM